MEARSAEGWQFERVEQRIARLTLVLGVAAGGLTAALYTWRWGLGLLVGALLAWLNFRWLRDALDALKRLSTAQAEEAKVQVPLGTWFRFVGRYALIGLTVYVIFEGLKVPILSILVGLCVLGAATLAASVYEILHPLD